MGWLIARLYDRVMARTEEACLGAWRRDLLEGVSGVVLEIGAGTGANLPHYPAGVDRLVLAEPDDAMRSRLERKLAARSHGQPVEVIPASAEELPFADDTFDAAVSTLVLCSVQDLGRAAVELRRVLRPGGRLHFLEHVAAVDRPSRLRWQRRLEPFWKRVAGNCHLTRRTASALTEGGFTLDSLEGRSLCKAPAIVRGVIVGAARA